MMTEPKSNQQPMIAYVSSLVMGVTDVMLLTCTWAIPGKI